MAKDTNTLLTNIISEFPDNTTGLITAAKLRTFLTDLAGKLNNNWYVDSVNGDDTTNDGRSYSTPYKTIGKLLQQTINAGDTIYLARGSQWREFLDLSTKQLITVKAYGAGQRPILDASDIATNANFSLTSGQTKTYQIQWTPLHGQGGAGDDVLSIWEDGTRLIRRTSIAEVEATAGSFFTAYPLNNTVQTVYIQPYNSSNPVTNGKIYEITKRYCGIQSGAKCTFESIHTRNNGGNNGSLYGGLDNLAVDCVFEDGTKHNAFMNSGEYRNCIFWKCEDGSNHQNATMGVFYSDDPTGMTGIARGCKFIGGNGKDYTLPNGVVGIFAHGNNPNVFFKYLYVYDCEMYNLTTPVGGSIAYIYIQNLKCQNCSSFGIGVYGIQNKIVSIRNASFIQKAGKTLPVMDITTNPGSILNISGLLLFANAFGNECVRVSGNGILEMSETTIIGANSGYGFRTLGGNTPTIKFFNSVLANVSYVTNFDSASTTWIADNNYYSSPNAAKLIWNYKNVNYTGLAAFKAANPTLEQKSLSGDGKLNTNPETGDSAFAYNSVIHSLKVGHQYKKAPFHFVAVGELPFAKLMSLPGAGVNPNNPITPGSFNPATVSATSWWTPRLAVTVTGTSVSQLSDNIGTNHLAQGSGVNQPQLTTKDVDLFNQPSISFDGAKQWIKGAIASGNQPFFIIAVLAINSIGGYIFDGNTFNSGGVIATADPSGYALDMFGGGYFGAASNFPINQYFILSYLFNGASSKMWVNGGAPKTGNAGTGNPGGLTIGTRGDGATTTGDTNPLRLAELIHISAEPTAANHNYLGTNLAYIYGGLPWTIPT